MPSHFYELALENTLSYGLKRAKIGDREIAVITNTIELGGRYDAVVDPLNLPDFPGENADE